MSMMRFSVKARAFVAGSSTLLALGSCALTDQQITSIAESAISTAINSLIRSLLDAFLATNTV